MAAEPSGAPASLVAFDTDVLIWYFRGSERARSFLQGFPHQNRLISALTVMELIQGLLELTQEVARQHGLRYQAVIRIWIEEGLRRAIQEGADDPDPSPVVPRS